MPQLNDFRLFSLIARCHRKEVVTDEDIFRFPIKPHKSNHTAKHSSHGIGFIIRKTLFHSISLFFNLLIHRFHTVWQAVMVRIGKKNKLLIYLSPATDFINEWQYDILKKHLYILLDFKPVHRQFPHFFSFINNITPIQVSKV